MAKLDIELFPCRSDNFGVLIHDPETGATASIDAPEEQPILDAFETPGLDADAYSHHPSSYRPCGRQPGAEDAL